MDKPYSAAGEVLSRNDASRSVYTFHHNYLNTTVTYYRLKMDELDGSFNYSPVIRIGADARTGVKIYPNTITNDLVNIISWQPVENVRITNLNGLQVLTKDLNGANGYFNVALPVLQKGFYLVRISGPNFQQTEKIFIQ